MGEGVKTSQEEQMWRDHEEKRVEESVAADWHVEQEAYGEEVWDSVDFIPNPPSGSKLEDCDGNMYYASIDASESSFMEIDRGSAAYILDKLLSGQIDDLADPLIIADAADRIVANCGDFDYHERLIHGLGFDIEEEYAKQILSSIVGPGSVGIWSWVDKDEDEFMIPEGLRLPSDIPEMEEDNEPVYDYPESKNYQDFDSGEEYIEYLDNGDLGPRVLIKQKRNIRWLTPEEAGAAIRALAGSEWAKAISDRMENPRETGFIDYRWGSRAYEL